MHVTTLLPRLILALLLPVLAACASAPQHDGSTDFVIVRHAEKVTDGSDDPPLTATGQRRAQAIADWLADAAVVAVYSTDTRRTRQTAAPTAQAHGVPVSLYDGRQPAAEFATQLRHDHTSGTVLVLGHSNTAPAIAAALCHCEVAAMDETEYDRRMTVHVDSDGNASVSTTRSPLP